MTFLYYLLFAAAVVGLDQFTKYLTVTHIAPPSNALPEDLALLREAFHLTDSQLSGLPAQIDFIPGVLDFSHVHNHGAAFSSFEGQQWLFAVIFAVFTVLILWEYFKKPMGFNKFERWCIAAIYAGGLGNMIDRVRLGYVVDMFRTLFMDFPVFNVADCFITCGCFAMMFSLFFFNREFWKEEKSKH